jgi:hypothetical protein
MCPTLAKEYVMLHLTKSVKKNILSIATATCLILSSSFILAASPPATATSKDVPTLTTPPLVANGIDYAIVVAKTTHEDKQWKPVIAALAKKHRATIITYKENPGEALPQLQQQHPKYTCFVTKSAGVTKDFVADVHQLTRRYDSDPYTDTFWGILTGYTPANALAIAEYAAPLTVRKVASGTEVALEMCEEGLWYDELVKHKMVQKKKGEQAKQHKGPGDTTQAIVNTLNDYKPDLFVTSGHATERGWQLGFRYRNGFVVSKAGQLIGKDTNKKLHHVDSQNAKVYLPIGNCLMGHIDSSDAMALAWMNDAGVKQMIGYTVPTWFGYGGWGCLDYFVEQPGRYTVTQAFFANHHALIHRLAKTDSPQDKRGLTFDRDVVAFYGDPKWTARMAPAKKAYEQKLTIKDNVYTFTITPNRGSDSFKPVNTNGAQRGWRPIVQFLPNRIKNIKLLTGQDLKPVVTDDFILIPNPKECDPSKTYQIKFEATVLN